MSPETDRSKGRRRRTDRESRRENERDGKREEKPEGLGRKINERRIGKRTYEAHIPDGQKMRTYNNVNLQTVLWVNRMSGTRQGTRASS